MPVRRILTGHKQLEGGGFEVTRPFPSAELPMVDPFLLLDQMGPKELGPGEAVGAPDHPHRGFETVTYMLEGVMEHKDSHGHHGVLRPGDVQWMTAGSGVVHSEMPAAQFLESGGRSHGIQLWVNLPAADKMTAPRYQDVPAASIPEASIDGGTVRVISGQYAGASAVIDTRIPIQYLHFRLEPGATADAAIDDDHNGFVYVLENGGTIDGAAVSAGQIALLAPGALRLQAGPHGLNAILLSGRPIGEPVARYGPFVMNTRDEIIQAIRDFQEGRFGEIAPEVGGG